MTTEFIPEGFLSKLLDEFGIQWTHLAIISGVVFSSFGIERYLNPGVWILATVAAFGTVYLFRDQIGKDFPRVALWCFVVVVAAVLVPIAIISVSGGTTGGTLKDNRDLGTLYLAFVVGVPLGVAIISYRKQEDEKRSDLPRSLQQAVTRGVIRADFVHERVDYEVELAYDDAVETPSVWMKYEVRMQLKNRTSRIAQYEDIFDPAGEMPEFLYVMIAGKMLDPNDPDRRTERGLVLSRDVDPGQTIEIVVRAQSRYHVRDSELIGVYLPSAEMSIASKRLPDELTSNFQSFLPRKVDPQVLSNGDQVFEWREGLLPFQGARLFWSEKRPGP